MASRHAVAPHPVRGDAVLGDGKQQKKVGGGGENVRNRKALDDIGNLAVCGGRAAGPDEKPQTQITRPVTRSFGARLIAQAVATKKSDAPPAEGKKAAAVKKPTAALQKKANVVVKPNPKEVIVISPDTVEKENDNRNRHCNNSKSAGRRKKVKTTTSILTARSQIACGVTEKTKSKEAVIDIDAEDVNNELAVVEYVEDIYKFYKLAETETKVHDYMSSQPELNEKMRSILVDWLIEVHNRFDLMPETLYLTINLIDRFLSVKTVPRRELQLVGLGAMLIACKYEEIWAPEMNDFVAISDRVFSHEQILRMEKAILGKLEWYLTVPTVYVFMTRFIKASIPDDEMENMVNYLSELGLMSYNANSYLPSMVAASAVYVARKTLNKSPVWTETLRVHTGFAEVELAGCSKLLVKLQSAVKESKLQVVYRKYSKAEQHHIRSYPHHHSHTHEYQKTSIKTVEQHHILCLLVWSNIQYIAIASTNSMT